MRKRRIYLRAGLDIKSFNSSLSVRKSVGFTHGACTCGKSQGGSKINCAIHVSSLMVKPAIDNALLLTVIYSKASFTIPILMM